MLQNAGWRFKIGTGLCLLLVLALDHQALADTDPNTLSADRFSPLAMIANADPIVQGVMLFLALCSVASWAILIEKTMMLGRIQGESRRFLTALQRALSIKEAGNQAAKAPETPICRMWQAAAAEWAVMMGDPIGGAMSPHQRDQVLQRMVVAATITQEQEMQRLSMGMGMLATIGSTAPFIGLFGTVWGILNSFIGIAATKATSLAVVAPGIAEALLATAIGLVTAIPAVIIYNHFARRISSIIGLLDNFQGALACVVSRELAVNG